MRYTLALIALLFLGGGNSALAGTPEQVCPDNGRYYFGLGVQALDDEGRLLISTLPGDTPFQRMNLEGWFQIASVDGVSMNANELVAHMTTKVRGDTVALTLRSMRDRRDDPANVPEFGEWRDITVLLDKPIDRYDFARFMVGDGFVAQPLVTSGAEEPTMLLLESEVEDLGEHGFRLHVTLENGLDEPIEIVETEEHVHPPMSYDLRQTLLSVYGVSVDDLTIAAGASVQIDLYTCALPDPQIVLTTVTMPRSGLTMQVPRPLGLWTVGLY